MKRLLSVGLSAWLLASAMLLTMLVPSAFASLTCPSGSDDHLGPLNAPVMAILYEEPYDKIAAGTYPNGHVLCIHGQVGSSVLVPNLKNVAYTWYRGVEDSVCYGQLFTSYGTWNDCITGARLNAGCHWSLTLYSDSNYGSQLFSWNSTGANPDIGAGRNNTASSLKLSYLANC